MEQLSSIRFVETRQSTANRPKINARELFDWLKPVLKPVNYVSTSKIMEVSKEHAQRKSQAACCTILFRDPFVQRQRSSVAPSTGKCKGGSGDEIACCRGFSRGVNKPRKRWKPCKSLRGRWVRGSWLGRVILIAQVQVDAYQRKFIYI